MERFTSEEALVLVTDGSDTISDEESDIDEDPAFLLPHSASDAEQEELAVAGTLSPSHTTSFTPTLPTISPTPAVNSSGQYNSHTKPHTHIHTT